MKDKIYRNVIYFGLASVMVFAPLALGANRLWSITFVELVVLTLVFLWFWQMNNKRGWNLRPTALDLPIWSFVALASISCVFTIYLHDSLFSIKRLLVMVAVYYLIINNFSDRRINRLMDLIVIVGVSISLIGLAQYFLDLPRLWWADERLISSTYVNHNHFAGYLELAMPLSVGLFFGEKNLRRKIGFGLAGIVMLMAFIYAQSRGAWASIALAVVIMTFYLSRKRVISKTVFVVALLSLLLIFAIMYAGYDDIALRAETMVQVRGDASFLTRVKIWQGTVDMIKANPVIGTGIGTLLWGFPRYRPVGLYHKIIHAHNDYLHMIAEMGLLALPLMLWMMFVVTRRCFTLSVNPRYAGIAVGLLSIFLHGLIDFNFHIPANMILVSVFCAFVIIEEIT